MGLRKGVNSLLGLHELNEHLRQPPDRLRSMHYPLGEGLRLFAGIPPEKIQVVSPGLRNSLRLCTENLGSESCEGTLEPEEEAALEAAAADEKAEREEAAGAGGEAEVVMEHEWPVRWRRRREDEERRKFPPPLRWMANGDGRPAGFIKAAREGGRLILREVRFERPEVLRGTREVGRLRLHLVGAERVEEARQVEKAEEEASPGTAKEDAERWERDGFRRCQEAASGDREVPAWWNHRFATIA